MNESSSGVTRNLSALQSSVQQKLGRCMLRLQQYEALLKKMLPYASFSGHPAELPALLAHASDFIGSQTMGALVGMLKRTYLGSSILDKGVHADTDANTSGHVFVRSHTQIVFDVESYEVIKTGLKELVTLRNLLVHHFLAKFDIAHTGGCLAAEAFLDSSFESIDAHFTTLRGWAKTIFKAHSLMASTVGSSAFQDFLSDGIAPDGTVHWSWSGIVQGLRDAEAKLAVNGWASLNSAIAWMHLHAPEQTPERYGCTTWRQVLHNSKQFDVFKQAARAELRDKPLASVKVWYRSRQLPVESQI